MLGIQEMPRAVPLKNRHGSPLNRSGNRTRGLAEATPPASVKPRRHPDLNVPTHLPLLSPKMPVSPPTPLPHRGRHTVGTAPTRRPDRVPCHCHLAPSWAAHLGLRPSTGLPVTCLAPGRLGRWPASLQKVSPQQGVGTQPMCGKRNREGHESHDLGWAPPRSPPGLPH